MPRYFAGKASDFGHVASLPQGSFAALCSEVFARPTELPLTREELHALPEKEQQSAKRVGFVTSCTFKADPSPRKKPEAVACNLVALDIDSAEESVRLLSTGFSGLQDRAFIAWHTARSTPEKPRLRVLVSAEAISPTRYAAAVRTVGAMLGMTNLAGVIFTYVQPMFLPTIYKGESASPIVASNPDGEPLLLEDITEADVPSAEAPVAPSTEQIADLSFLRTPIEGVTLADVAGALEYLDPDMQMLPWVEIGAGIKHQLGDAGFPLWDAWSAKGSKYPGRNELTTRWTSLKAQPTDRVPVTCRSLFKQARAKGWDNKELVARLYENVLAWINAGERTEDELMQQGAKRIAKVASALGAMEFKLLLGALKEKLSSFNLNISVQDIRKEVIRLEAESIKASGPPAWAHGWCFVTAANMYYRYEVDRKFTPEVLDQVHVAPLVGDKPMRARDYLMRVCEIPCVENWVYDPSRSNDKFFTEDEKPWINTYRASYAASDPDSAEEAGRIFSAHVGHLIAKPEYQRIFISYLAYLVQKPGAKIRWTAFLQGAMGCGKSAIGVAMTAVLGRTNVRKISASNIMDTAHNDWAYGQQLGIIEEVRIVGANRYSVMDAIKPVITDDEIPLRAMYEAVRTVKNTSNYLMFTNYRDALAVNEEDRRYFILCSALQRADQVKALGAGYFTDLYDMIRDNAGGLRAWFEQYPLDPLFVPEGRAPMTEFLHQMAEDSASPLARAVRQAIEDTPHPLVQSDLLSATTLRGVLSTQRLPEFSEQALSNVLHELGWERYGREVVDGQKHTLWVYGPRTGNPGDLARARAEII